MPVANYYDVDHDVHELQHLGDFVVIHDHDQIVFNSYYIFKTRGKFVYNFERLYVVLPITLQRRIR